MKRVALVLALALSISGCATVAATLPTVIAAVTDGVMILDAVQRFVDAYFASHPTNPETKSAVQSAIDKARSSLNVALRTAQGAEKLDQAKVDEAFASFKAAYVELLAVVGPLGVLSGDANSKMTARPNTLVVPEPTALTLKVK